MPFGPNGYSRLKPSTTRRMKDVLKAHRLFTEAIKIARSIYTDMQQCHYPAFLMYLVRSEATSRPYWPYFGLPVDFKPDSEVVDRHRPTLNEAGQYMAAVDGVCAEFRMLNNAPITSKLDPLGSRFLRYARTRTTNLGGACFAHGAGTGYLRSDAWTQILQNKKVRNRMSRLLVDSMTDDEFKEFVAKRIVPRQMGINMGEDDEE